MEAGAHIIVIGMVQGVGFRYFVYARAKNLGLTGSVRNLYDGSVEILVEGERSLVEELIRGVKVGPRAAHVSDLKIHWNESRRQYAEFIVK
jgi:acylphosphatase